MTFRFKENDEIAADIAASVPQSTTPEELKARMLAFGREHPERVQGLKMGLLAFSLIWIEEGLREGFDREVLERMVGQEATMTAAVVVESMKRRMGEPQSSARFAIVAYQLADVVHSLPWDDVHLDRKDPPYSDESAGLADWLGQLDGRERAVRALRDLLAAIRADAVTDTVLKEADDALEAVRTAPEVPTP